MTLRADASALLPAGLALLALSSAAGLALGWARGRPSWVAWSIFGVAVLVALRFVGLPFAWWWGATYELTTRRLALRWGVVARHARSVPLARVVDVRLERSVWQRLVGSGSVIVHVAGDDEALRLIRLPQAERFAGTLSELAARAGSSSESSQSSASSDEAVRR